MVIFDSETVFEADGTAVLRAKIVDGSGQGRPFEFRITRPYAEETWRVRFSEKAIRTQIWMRINEFRDAVASASASGRSLLVL
jgi:hypothetical protein